MAGSEMFSLTVVSSDLRSEETILHSIRSLEEVSEASKEVLKKISEKLSNFQTKIEELDKRIEISAFKIDRLKELKKATVIYSSAKYPCEAQRQDFVAIFSPPPFVFQSRLKTPRVKERVADFDPRKIQNKLQHFHTKERPVDITVPQHLGDIPPDMRSCTSLLIFNTAENPFQIEAKIDPLEVILKNEDVPEVHGVDAPDGAGQPDRTVGVGGGGDINMFYSPDMEELPDFQLPDELELPNIAQGLDYSAGKEPGIAPSVNLRLFDLPEVLEELPEVLEDVPGSTPNGEVGTDNFPILPPPSIPELPSAVTSPVQALISPILAPTSPPASAESAIPTSIATEQTVTPAPTPTPTTPSVNPEPPAPVKEPPSNLQEPQDGRGGLLEAIRKAGGASGAGLKSIKDRKAEERLKREEEKAGGGDRDGKGGTGGGGGGGGGGDLMGDLMAKLTMRRKGISGAKQQSGGGGVSGGALSTMDKISLMIPPPPSKDSIEDSIEDNDEDQEDWD